MDQQNINLSQVLSAIFNPDQNIRVSAEKEIEKLSNANLGAFIFELSTILSNEKEANNIRQLSATLIKNKIKTSSEMWFNIDENLKTQIKNNILATLITTDNIVKKATALCIAGICTVELPKNIWMNIFDTLINASQNNNTDIKITSLITLGYIFEDIIDKKNYINISKENIAKITNMYYNILATNNINGNNNVIVMRNCLLSLERFVPFLEGIICEDNMRLTFFNLIKENMLNSDEEIREYSINIFSSLIGYYYKYFSNYIDTLMQTLFQIIEKDSEKNKKRCLGVLLTIGEKEMNIINTSINFESNYNFLNKYKTQISQIVLKYIITDKFDEEEFNTFSNYCSMLILYMSICCEYKFIEDMLDYYKNNILSNNPVNKFSALNVFRSLMEAKEKTKIFPIIQESLPLLSSILLESQTILSVRKLIAIIIKKISKNFGFLIIKDESLFDKFMALFLNLLNDSQPQIVYKILESIYVLIIQIETNEHLETNLLSQYSKNYYGVLLSLSQNINLFIRNNNVSMMALFTLGSFGQHSANDIKTLTYNVFRSLVEMFSNTLNKAGFSDEEMRLNYQEYICTSLGSILKNKKARDKDVRNLFNYVIQSFQQRQEIYDEGISLIGSIASFLQRGFINEMSTFNSYLLHGLNSTNSFYICKASILSLDEIIINTGPDFNMYVEKYLKIVLNILSDNNINRDLKPLSFGIISELFIACPQEAFVYFDDIMRIVGIGFEACRMDYGPEKENIDFIYYIMELKERLLEIMMCVFNAVRDTGKINDFVPYAKSTVEFINIILRDEAKLNDDIIKNALGTIAQFCESYGKNIKPILNIDLLKNTIEKLRKKNDNTDKELEDFIIWVQKALTDVVISN